MAFSRLNILTLNYALRVQIVYFIETPDLHQDFKDMGRHFDTSNYPTDHSLFSLTNKAVPGLMKDEFAGKYGSEFVGLRSK